MWNMQVTIIPIVIGAFGTVTKGLLKGLEDLEVGGRVETIQTTALLRTARILRRVWRREKTCCHSDFSEKPSAISDVKSSNEWTTIIIIKVIHREMCKKFKFDYANKWYMHNPAPVLENDTHKFLWEISTRRPDLIITNKKKICKIVDFAVPADHRIKLKECETRDKYLDLERELKKLWNMKVKIIPIVIGAFGTVTKWLLKGLEDLEVGGRVETIQTTALLKTARILRRILETWGDLLSLNLQWKTSSLRWCEKL